MTDNQGDSFALPLSFAQERLWFLDQLKPGNPAYNVPMTLRLVGSLNIAAMQQSFQWLIERHEILRTIFLTEQGQPVQVILPALTLPFSVEDLSGISEPEQQLMIRRLCGEATQRPFDLARDALIRVVLLRLGEASHLLVLTVHHIICDGWSMGVFFQELAALYQAALLDQAPSLPPLSIQYADFAHWQRTWLEDGELDRLLAYWQQQLQGPLPNLELPLDYARRPAELIHAAFQVRVLPPALMQALGLLSQREGITNYVLLLAAVQTLLFRYSGNTDIRVGILIANRTQPELEGMLGMFANVLVLRTDLADNPPFRRLLHRALGVTLGAFDHQDMPFVKLVEKLRPQRAPDQTPLFQVMFMFQNFSTELLSLPGLTVHNEDAPNAFAKFDLSLGMWSGADSLVVATEYNADIFSAATISRLLEHLQELLEAIIADPDQRVADLPMLTEAEREQRRGAWSSTGDTGAGELCFHQLFEAQVRRAPDAIALAGDDRYLSYQALDRRANQLAHYLRSLGVGPETPVGISMEYSHELFLAIIAVLKAGATYVPLAPGWAPEWLESLLQHAQVGIVLTYGRLQPQLSTRVKHTLYLDDDWDGMIGGSPAEPTVSAVHAAHLACVSYTCDAAGRPLGGLMTHRELVRHAHWLIGMYELTSADRLAADPAAPSDVIATTLLAALVCGAGLVVTQPDQQQAPADLQDALTTHQVSVLLLPTALLHRWAEAATLLTCQSIRSVVCCGEVMLPDVPARFFARHHAQLSSLYGQAGSAFAIAWRNTPAGSQLFPVGRLIGCMPTAIFDQGDRLAPAGVVGEIVTGVDQFARGYLADPVSSATALVPDPRPGLPGARLHRSGYLARYLADGDIVLLGKAEQQVRIEGTRLDLQVLAAWLEYHPAVRQAAVVIQKDHGGRQRLVAYIVPWAETLPAEQELGRHLRDRMPLALIPVTFVRLDQLPTTPQGTVDRRSLAANAALLAATRSRELPRDALERLLAEIWEQTLGVQSISITDNFFDLGGHSMLSIQLLAQVQSRLQCTIPLAVLFEEPTIEHLAAVLRRQLGE